MRSRRAVSSPLLALATGLLAAAVPLSAQEEAPEAPPGAEPTAEQGDRTASRASGDAELLGRVVSAQTGKPIDGARVSVPDLGVGAVSGAEGEFLIRGLPAGEFSVRVQYLGHATNERPVRLEDGHVTRAVYLLDRDVLEVADLQVTVRRSEGREPRSNFRRRMEERRFGAFITREDIEEHDPQHTSDMLREIPGLKVTPVEFGQATVYMTGGTGSRCRPTVFLDGLPAEGFQVDNLQPEAVEGIEVYRRPSEIPAEFKGVGPVECGVLAIWSQTGRISGR